MHQKYSGSFPSWDCRLKAFPVNSVVTALWSLSLIHTCQFCCMSLLLIAVHCSQKSFTFLRKICCSQNCSSGLLCLNLSYSTYYYDFQWNTLRKCLKIRFLSKITNKMQQYCESSICRVSWKASILCPKARQWYRHSACIPLKFNKKYYVLMYWAETTAWSSLSKTDR